MTQTASLPETLTVGGFADIARRRTETHDWRVLANYEQAAFGPGAPDWFALAACADTERVKDNRNRQVWRVGLGEQVVYVKVYRDAAPAEQLKSVLRGSPAWREWQAGLYAARIGLPAIVPIACARPVKPWSGGPSVLITHAVRHVVPLDQYWLAIRDDRRAVAELIDRLAATVARAHQGGFEHRDLHVRNLLVQTEAGARPRILLVDLHSVRLGRPVGDAAVVRNLAQLNQWFRRQASFSRRLAFLKRYLQWRHSLAAELPHGRQLGHDLRSLVEAMETRATRHATALWAKRDRRALRDGKYFAKVRLPGGWRGRVFLQAKHPIPGSPSSSSRLAASQWQTWLAGFLERLKCDPGLGLVKDSHSARVRRVTLPPELGGLEAVCKQSLARTPFRRLTGGPRRSRDWRAWRRGYALLNRDLPTARPLAVLERRVCGWLTDSLVLTERVPGGRDLEQLARTVLPDLDAASGRRLKNQLIELLVRLIKNLHARGLAHRDFKASNVLVTGIGGPPSALRAWLIDLDGLRLRRRLTERDRLHVLMRLSVSLEGCPAVTRTDRLRLLRRFMLAPGRSDARWKQLWRQLQSWSELKARQKARRTAWKLRQYGRR